MRRITTTMVALAAALSLIGVATATPAPPTGLRVALERGGYHLQDTTSKNGKLAFQFVSADHRTARFAIRMPSQAVALIGANLLRTDIAYRQQWAQGIRTVAGGGVTIVKVQTWNRYVVVTVRRL